jgi:hypothetical protein
MMSAPDIVSPASGGFGRTFKAVFGFRVMAGSHGNGR